MSVENPNYYAIQDRSIWFEEDVTGSIEIVGISKVDLPDDESDTFGFSALYPLVYVYKVLSILLPGNSGSLFLNKYEDEKSRVKSTLSKQDSIGRIYLEEL